MLYSTATTKGKRNNCRDVNGQLQEEEEVKTTTTNSARQQVPLDGSDCCTCCTKVLRRYIHPWRLRVVMGWMWFFYYSFIFLILFRPAAVCRKWHEVFLAIRGAIKIVHRHSNSFPFFLSISVMTTGIGVQLDLKGAAVCVDLILALSFPPVNIRVCCANAVFAPKRLQNTTQSAKADAFSNTAQRYEYNHRRPLEGSG